MKIGRKKIHNGIVVLLILSLIQFVSYANDGNKLDLLPLPIEVKINSGEFSLSNTTSITSEISLINEAQKFAGKTNTALGYKLNIVEGSNAETGILLKHNEQLTSEHGKESYQINVSSKLISTKVGGNEGAFYAFYELVVDASGFGGDDCNGDIYIFLP